MAKTIERERIQIESGLIRWVARKLIKEGHGPGSPEWRECFPTDPTQEDLNTYLDRVDAEHNGIMPTAD